VNIVFLVSGNGGNLKFFYEVIAKTEIIQGKLYVIADRDCMATSFCMQKKIPYSIISYTRDKTRELQSILLKINPDVIITNWNKIIDSETVKLFHGKMINLHYSLLPAFSGMIGVKPIQEALKRNCWFLGATVHWVEEIVDGGKIITQSVFLNNGRFDQVLERVFRSGCFLLLNTLLMLSNNEKSQTFQHPDILFSPQLSFNPLLFDLSFWNALKEL